MLGAKNQRIAYLDGLRGIAILSVVLFHYYYILPKNNDLLYTPISFFQYGYFGVMLFFAISGFVISQTLFHSNSRTQFFIKRFARLFPCMLLCSSATFLFSFVEPRIYYSTLANFLPSLTFIDPQIYNFFLKGQHFAWMDGVYWSLFTEVRFYLLVCTVYFYDKNNFARNYLIVACAVGLIFPIAILSNMPWLRSALNFILIANQLSWFTFGIGCYFLFIGNNKKFLHYTLVAFLSMSFYLVAITKRPYMTIDSTATFVSMIAIYLLMMSCIKITSIKNLLSFKPLTVVGLASYSLYLLHEEIGEKIIIMIAPVSQMAVYIPVIVLTLFIAASLTVYVYYEKPSKKIVYYLVSKLQNTLLSLLPKAFSFGIRN